MPDEMILMADVDTHTPVYMHSVDAAEASRSGDYVYVPPDADIDPTVKTAAMAQAKGMNAVAHPELQTPEQKERLRREANEYAAATAEAQGVPVPASVRQALDKSARPVPPSPAPAPAHPAGRTTGRGPSGEGSA